MNKLHITTGLVLFLLFGAIFVSNQQDSLFNGVKPTPIPTLPPDNLFATRPPQTQTQQQYNEQQAQAQAQQQIVPTVGIQEPIPASVSAKIKTSRGIIELKLLGDKAPGTVRNFMNKAQSGFYKNLTFHRVEDWVIQGGDPKGDGSGGGNMPVEFNDTPFIAGSLGVASRGDGQVQNDAQFFITKTESSHLNGKYTNFGMVTSGMDIVNSTAIGDKILDITIEIKQ
ncbi:hypothetical protein BH11PAT1_BH11PAT1_6650 [soil metagenome]